MARRNIDRHPKDEYKTKTTNKQTNKQKRKKEKEKKRKNKNGGSPNLENTAPVRHMSD